MGYCTIGGCIGNGGWKSGLTEIVDIFVFLLVVVL